MNLIRYCNECKWGILNRREVEVMCTHPRIEGVNSHSLACSNSEYRGSSCRNERRKTFWMFPKCGQVGKLWEPKVLNIAPPTGENNELPF